MSVFLPRIHHGSISTLVYFVHISLYWRALTFYEASGLSKRPGLLMTKSSASSSAFSALKFFLLGHAHSWVPHDCPGEWVYLFSLHALGIRGGEDMPGTPHIPHVYKSHTTFLATAQAPEPPLTTPPSGLDCSPQPLGSVHANHLCSLLKCKVGCRGSGPAPREAGALATVP